MNRHGPYINAWAQVCWAPSGKIGLEHTFSKVFHDDECSRCDDAWYCSKEHQRENWKIHKQRACLCSHGKKMAADIRAESVFPLWIQRQFDGDREFYDVHEQMFQEFFRNDNRSSYINRPLQNILRKNLEGTTMSQMVYIRKDPKHDDTASWYNADEELNFKLDARDEIAYYLRREAAGIVPSSAPIGLDGHIVTREHARKRIMKRRLVKHAVRLVQAHHISPHEHPNDKQDRIAMASMKCSKWSRVQARAIGIAQLSQQDVSVDM